jgi:hypothetical protein
MGIKLDTPTYNLSECMFFDQSRLAMLCWKAAIMIAVSSNGQ